MLRSTLLVLSVLSVLVVSNADIAKDKVTTLPGYPADLTQSKFSVYSGMLDIGGGKLMHYIFLTDLNNTQPTSSPLLIWLNGGPGCSSVDGWLMENGPYLFSGSNPNFNTANNPYAWNDGSNVLYFESPVGVGFSQAPAGYNYSDAATTADLYAALQAFYAGFNEYTHCPLTISGESYAGIYVPNLASYILNQNKGKAPTDQIPLQKILVGNGVANTTYLESQIPTIEFFYQRYLIPKSAYDGFRFSCQGEVPSPSCDFWGSLISELTLNINPYDIYGYCHYSASNPGAEVVKKTSMYAPWFKFGDDSNAPCVSMYGPTLWLNRPEVQDALHVPKQKWEMCSGDVFVKYVKDPAGSIAAYHNLLAGNIEIWVYSGDADAVVPFTDTSYWITNLGLPVRESWRAWTSPGDGQVGGYVQSYGDSVKNPNGLKFVTVRGAGHMVPQDKPVAAFTLLQSVLHNQPLPTA